MNKKRKSIASQLRSLMLTIMVPMTVLIILTIIMFISYDYQYEKAGANITRASGFNQNFKDDIDLKMYYFATDSEYASGLPEAEVAEALQLANSLYNDTTNRDSRKAIASVQSLCENLQDRITQIAATPVYEDRITQLESNVYILTELIENYMSSYLYYEAGELAGLQRTMRIWLLIEIGCVILVTIILVFITIKKSVRISRSITRPIDELYLRAESIGSGELEPGDPIYAEDIKVQALSDGFEEMIARLKSQMELNKQEAERIRSMELMLLQAQINPHFLYNTLDSIIWLIETGAHEQAIEMVTSLSNFFRTSLSNGRDVISLDEEKLHVQSYLEIQHVRYRDILSYSIDIDESIGRYQLPKLTLQPIVENALYHGIKQKRGRGTISITGRGLADEGIELVVRDTGIGMSAEELEKVRRDITAEHAEGFGMSAVYKRLKLMFKDACTLTIDSVEGQETTVTIKLPSMWAGSEVELEAADE